MEDNVVDCPHCGGTVILISIGCGVFRHGFFKSGEQMPPHASEAECRAAIRNGKIVGCGQPFKVEYEGKKMVARICGFI